MADTRCLAILTESKRLANLFFLNPGSLLWFVFPNKYHKGKPASGLPVTVWGNLMGPTEEGP